MPPQGLLLIAAYLPENWPVRFIDENIRPAAQEDFEWAEAVFVSGMHIQRQQMNDICRRAHAFDLPVAIGGPSVWPVRTTIPRSTISMSANSAMPPTICSRGWRAIRRGRRNRWC